jgi:glycerol-3-phosphate dehydrogenase (NAD(P)+)
MSEQQNNTSKNENNTEQDANLKGKLTIPQLQQTNRRVSILGAGAFGIALAEVLSQKNHIRMWDYNKTRAEFIQNERHHPTFLPEHKLNDRIVVSNDLKQILKDAEMLFIAVPANTMRSVCEKAASVTESNTIIINCAKGLEVGTHWRMTQIIKKYFKMSNKRIVLCGPSHAEEIVSGKPASVVLSGKQHLEEVQYTLITPRFRVYTNTDIIGAELAGAMKNVIAIAVGLSEGLGLGDNAKAALMTRGLREIINLGVKLGAKEATFYGLAGVGDLIATCYSPFSRNRHVGMQLAKGHKLDEILAGMNQVAEGIKTTKAVLQAAESKRLDMPVSKVVDNVLTGILDPNEGIEILMTRAAKPETKKSLLPRRRSK